MGEHYVKEIIEADPIDSLAWFLSELDNDRAPIGWTRYRSLAHSITKSKEFHIRYARARKE